MGRRMAAYRNPKGVRCTCRRGALSVEGRSQFLSVASAPPTRAGTKSDECRLELCAESIAPSRICAQLQGMITFAMLTLVSAVGAHGAGAKGGMSSCGPM